MSRRASSRGDRGKAPVHAMSYEDSSSNDEIASANEQAAQVLHIHFDYGGDDFQ